MIIRAFAKMNLTLEILGRSAERHLIASIFQSVSLADELFFSPRKDGRIAVEWERPPAFPILNNSVENMLKWIQEKEQVSLGMQVQVRKRIPIGGGMGGESADAAACIPAVEALWGVQKTQKEWMEVAGQMGADVPFFLSGGGTRLLKPPDAFFQPLFSSHNSPLTSFPSKDTALQSSISRLTFVAIYPGFPSSTKEAYEAWDADGTPTDGALTHRVARLLREGNEVEGAREMKNAFEESLFKRFPVLRSIQEAMLHSEPSPLNVLLMGSGSSLAGIFAGEESARIAARKWRSNLFGEVYALRPVPHALSPIRL